MHERSAKGEVRGDCSELTKTSLGSKENKMNVDVSRSMKSSANRSKSRAILVRFLPSSNKRNGRKNKRDISNNNFDHFHGDFDISAFDLLRICKPVSVRVVRLPDSTARVQTPIKKKKRIYHWRHGADMVKRRRRRKRERLRMLRRRVNNVSSYDRNGVNNATEQIKGHDEINGSTVREIDVSERQEYNLSFTAERNVPDDFVGTNNHEYSKGNANLSAALDCENQRVDETNRTLNPLYGTRRTFIKPAEKRKVSLVFDSEESEQDSRSLQHFKRGKILCMPFVRISPTTEGSSDDVLKESSFQREKVLLQTLDPHFLKTPEKHCKSDVMVVVNRLDNSYNPLIQKWKDKSEKSPTKHADVDTSCDAIINFPSTPFSKGVDVASRGGIVNTTKRTTTSTITRANIPDGEPTNPNGVSLISEGIGNASEDDDDEIMGFLATRRRVRPSIDSSDPENLFDGREYRKTPSLGTDVEIPPISNSDWANLQQLQNSISVEKSKSSGAASTGTSLNGNEIANKNRPRASLKCISKERTNSLDFADTEVRKAPITRSKSRAAMERLYRDCETDSTESQDCEQGLHTTMAEIHEVEGQFLNRPEDNLSDITENELNHQTADLLKVTSRVHSDIETNDKTEVACGNCDITRTTANELTAMKNVMVVLTRLEDLFNNSKVHGHCDTLNGFRVSGESGFASNDSSETANDRTNETNAIDFEDDADQNTQQYDFVPVTTKNTRNEEIIEEAETLRSSQGTTETDDGMILQEQCSQETLESEAEFRLVLDEGEKESSEEYSTCNLSEGIQPNENVNNERAKLNLKTHNCITSNTSFNDTFQLVEHRTSNTSCTTGFRCTLCPMSFRTRIELTKHQVDCAEKDLRKQKSVNEVKVIANMTILEPIVSKKKQTKQQNQKNAKKLRSQSRCREENLTCNVCSTNFETKSALSEHIYKHNMAELQEAYISAKARANLRNNAEGREKKKKRSKKHSKKSMDSDTTLSSAIDVPPSANVVENLPLIGAPNVSTGATSVDCSDLPKSSVATVCACHRDDDLTTADNGELQIEMVLLCKYCQVLFRRRECLEIHYRTSTSCATDRTRERWPRFYCANCKSILNTWADMRNHLQVHSDRNSQGRVRFVCNICRVIFFGFGALFYTHWHNHIRDTMFVACRYNFPKISVQPMDGTQKLPAGIRSGENFMFVAEHVCASCKNAFSTRKELDVHQKISICKKKNTNSDVQKDNTIYSCDSCHLTFANKESLDDHGKDRHKNHWVYVGIVNPSNEITYKCGKCSVMKKSVEAVEEHWKTHTECSASLRTDHAHSPDASTSERVPTNSSGDHHRKFIEGLSNSVTIPTNGVTSIDNTNIEPAVITIMDGNIKTGKSSGFHTPVEIQNSESIRTRLRDENGESSISVLPIRNTKSNGANDLNDLSVLRGVFDSAPSKEVRSRKRDIKPSGTKRALEDPVINGAMLDMSSTDISGSLVIDESENSTVVPEKDNMKTNSYQILMSNQGTSGPIKIVLSRNSLSGTEGTIEQPTVSQLSSELRDETLDAEGTQSRVVSVDKTSSSLDASKAVIEETMVRCLNQTDQLDKTDQPNTSNPLTRDPANLPEIIDIVDEADNCQKLQGLINTNSPNKAKKTKRKTVKSVIGQSPKGVPLMKNDVKKCIPKKTNGQSAENSSETETNSNVVQNRSDISDHSSSHSLAMDASKMSFEEARWMALRASAHFSNADHGEMKMQGFLRVKNLSELQAVKTHICPTCDAAFESYTSLVEHCQVHLPDACGKDVQYPKGMSAALVLPDPSERPKTPKKMQTRILEKKTRSVQKIARSLQLSSHTSPSPLIEFLTSRGSLSGDQTPGIISNKKSTGKVNGQRIPASLTPRIDSTNSLESSSVRIDLGSQRLTDNPLSSMTNTVIIPSTNISQNQDNPAGYQQTISSSTALIQDANRNFNRNSSTGYHVLPPMVVLPSSQVSKQQYGIPPQRNSPNNNFPTTGPLSNSTLTYQNNNINKYLCNICHSFRCDTREALNSHVTKHYTGWTATTAAQNPLISASGLMLSATTTMPVSTIIGTPQDSAGLGSPNYDPMGPESAGNALVFSNWTVKNTPQGPVLVTPVSSSPSQHSSTKFVCNNGPRPQVVYRCTICKSAMYRDYSALRDHLILVHGIVHPNLENIVQRKYQCTQCPGTTALFDCQDKYRHHANTNHSHACPTCRRSFVSVLSLKSHMEHCHTSVSSDRDSYGANC